MARPFAFALPFPFRNCGCPVLAFLARAGTMPRVRWDLPCPADCIAPTARIICRYMHRNPVERGLVMSPEQWRWSSYRFYLLDEAGPVRVNVGWGVISLRDRVA